MKRRRHHLFIILLLVVFSGVITSCRSNDSMEKTWVKSPGWSRAILLGTTSVGDQVPVIVGGNETVYTILIKESENSSDGYYPELIAIGSDGYLDWKKPLDITIARPDRPKMVLMDDTIWLFWLDAYDLYTIKADYNGNLLNEPILLSEETAVGSYAVACSGDGAIDVWYSGKRDEPGLYALALDTDVSGRCLIDPEGVHVSLAYDQKNDLHAVWAHYPKGYVDVVFYYAYYPKGEIVLDRQSEIFRREASPSLLIKGPSLAFDFNTVYVLWDAYVNAGLEAGSLETRYVEFSPGTEPQVSAPMEIHIPIIYKLEYEMMPDSSLNTGERVLLAEYAGPSTSEFEDISANALPMSESVIVFSSKSQHLWSAIKRQVNILYLKDGMPISYQPISFSSMQSTTPSITTNPDGDLYLTWLEKKNIGNDVYFVTTAPSMSTALNETTLVDVTNILGETLFGILAGITLMPLVTIVWGGVASIALVVTVLFRQFNSKYLKTIGEIVGLIMAVGIFWVNKLTTLSVVQGGVSLTDGYVPFSAWIPGIPDTFYLPLQIGFPILISLVSLYTAWYYTYKRSSRSSLYFILIYAAADSLLSMAIYGIVLWNAF